MQKIVTFLTFDHQAEDAMNFYVSLFKNSKIISVSRYGKSHPDREGTVMTGIFELDGQRFYVLNAGPQFPMSMGISLFVYCETQQEIDHLWTNLTEGGKEIQCGWLTDRFGVTWQIVPTILSELMNDKDPAKAGRVMQAMMKMVKLDIAKLKEAYGKG